MSARLTINPGDKFGYLTIIREVSTRGIYRRFECRCDCGKIKIVAMAGMRSGAIVSCGCYQKRVAVNIHKTHGGYKSRLYIIWTNIKQRCGNPHNKHFIKYGGRGITLCNEWEKSFELFRTWSYENGYSDNLTIDRIDNNGNYCPENCRWISNSKQQLNKRTNRIVTHNGRSMPLSEWAKITGLKWKTLQGRLDSGWPTDKALTAPISIKH